MLSSSLGSVPDCWTEQSISRTTSRVNSVTVVAVHQPANGPINVAVNGPLNGPLNGPGNGPVNGPPPLPQRPSEIVYPKILPCLAASNLLSFIWVVSMVTCIVAWMPSHTTPEELDKFERLRLYVAFLFLALLALLVFELALLVFLVFGARVSNRA